MYRVMPACLPYLSSACYMLYLLPSRLYSSIYPMYILIMQSIHR